MTTRETAAAAIRVELSDADLADAVAYRDDPKNASVVIGYARQCPLGRAATRALGEDAAAIALSADADGRGDRFGIVRCSDITDAWVLPSWAGELLDCYDLGNTLGAMHELLDIYGRVLECAPADGATVPESARGVL